MRVFVARNIFMNYKIAVLENFADMDQGLDRLMRQTVYRG